MHVKVSWRRSIQSSPCPRGTLILFKVVQYCSNCTSILYTSTPSKSAEFRKWFDGILQRKLTAAEVAYQHSHMMSYQSIATTYAKVRAIWLCTAIWCYQIIATTYVNVRAICSAIWYYHIIATAYSSSVRAMLKYQSCSKGVESCFIIKVIKSSWYSKCSHCI